jgi:hypothetical protein
MKTFQEWLRLKKEAGEPAGFDDNSSFGGPQPGSPADKLAQMKKKKPQVNTVGGGRGTMGDEEYDKMQAKTNRSPLNPMTWFGGRL